MKWYKRYTTKEHVYRLKLMFNKIEKNSDLSCDDLCPAARELSSNQMDHSIWINDPCVVCRGFLGIKDELRTDHSQLCPCHFYGDSEAAHSVTWKAINKWEAENAG
jgi:hypothetical protein